MIRSIVLGGGCFWCTEAIMQEQAGVIQAVPGYTGGGTEDPDYEQVSTGTTGHAEVVKVEYDDRLTNLHDILGSFFRTHDPTSLNRQGDDVGTQYRSAVYYVDDADLATIRHEIAMIERVLNKKVVTEVKPLDIFYEAEAYHHNYYRNNPYASYCQLVIAPKLQRFHQRDN